MTSHFLEEDLELTVGENSTCLCRHLELQNRLPCLQLLKHANIVRDRSKLYLLCCILHHCRERSLLRDAESTTHPARSYSETTDRRKRKVVRQRCLHSIGELWIRCQGDLEGDFRPAQENWLDIWRNTDTCAEKLVGTYIDVSA